MQTPADTSAASTTPATEWCPAWLLRPAAIWWILAATALVAAIAPLLHQEAYYALYAHHLDWSYFDHPPMVGWSIRVGIELFGNSALGVRFAPLVFGLCFTWAGVRWMTDLGFSASARGAFVALTAGIPLIAGNRLLAMTDAPLCAFWALAVSELWRVRSTGSIAGWMRFGLFVGCAVLSKYSAAFLGFGAALVVVLDPALRRQLRTFGPFAAVAVAAFCCIPILIWNWQHDWISLLFQTKGRVDHDGLRIWWAQQLLLGQFFALSPLVAVGIAFGTVWWGRALLRRRDVRGAWILAFGAPMVVVFGTLSFGMQVKLNWLLPTYFALVVGLLGWIDSTSLARRRPRTMSAARKLAIGHAALLLLFPLAWFVPVQWNNTWSGWDGIVARMLETARALDAEDGVEGNVFCFSTDYEDAGQLEFHAWSDPGYAARPIAIHGQDVIAGEGHAQAIWDPIEARLGQDAVLVIRRPRGETDQGRIDSVYRFFDSVSPPEIVDVELAGHVVQSAVVLVCRGFHRP